MAHQIRKTVQLNKDNVEWLLKTYPSKTGESLSWACDMLLTEFRKAHEKTPQDYAMAGARSLHETLEG